MAFSLQKKIPGCEIKLYDYHTDICSLTLNFPLQKNYDFKQIHLLEHIILHYSKDQHNVNSKYFSIFLNGFTSATALSFTLNCHVSDIIKCVQYILDRIYNISHITDQIVHDEVIQTLIEEQKYYKNDYYKEFANIYKEPAPLYELGTLEEVYEEVIINNTCIIIWFANMHNINVRKALDEIEQFSFPSNNSLSFTTDFYPEINKNYRSSNQTGNHIIIRWTIPAPFYKSKAYFWLTYYIIKEWLLDFIRFNDNNDYGFQNSYKCLLYAFEFYVSFYSDRSNDSLLQIIHNSLLLESNFHLYKKIIHKQYLCYTYQPKASLISFTSLLYGDKKLRSIHDIAEDMMHITYEDFSERVHGRIDNIFIERFE